MTDYYLPSTSYRRPSQVRSQTDSVLSAQVEVPLILGHVEISQAPTNEPTAKWTYGGLSVSPISEPSSPSSTYSSSSEKVTWRRSRNDADFDELYDVSDSESEEVPLHYSGSITESVVTMTSKRNRYPSLTIPSPSTWPTVEKLEKSAKSSSIAPTPLSCFPTPSAALAKLSMQNLQVPTKSATPSLDGSMTSDELADISCPTTPDSDEKLHKEGAWDAPLQLHPAALETLNQIANTDATATAEQVLEVPQQEMQEVPGSGSLDGGINIVITSAQDEAAQNDEADPLSALSVPSPGGFFSSLNKSSRNTWCLSASDDAPSTSVAETFYGLPWTSDESQTEQTRSVSRAVESRQDSHDSMTLVDEMEVAEIEADSGDHKKKYEEDLQTVAAANLDRTTLWLTSQLNMQLDSNQSDSASTVVGSPCLKHKQRASVDSSIGSPSKKSVRFADKPASPINGSPTTPYSDSTFYRSFQTVQKGANNRDAFVYRKVRQEAISVERLCFPDSHCDQLHGRYEVIEHSRNTTSRPVSNFYEKSKNAITIEAAQAERERHAGDQMRQASWNLQATKMLNGGKLFINPAAGTKSNTSPPSYVTKKLRVLDLGGQATCDWAWQVALEYPRATVYTVTDQLATSKLRGPRNHRVVSVPNLWSLPFPDDSFDVISARTLYTMLKTTRGNSGEGADEYDRCLRECYRCLKPGGYIEFTLLDSDIINASGRQAVAASVEFGFNLKTRGYDPMPTKSFLGRLKGVGFEEIERAWIVLPFANTKSAGASTSASAGGSTTEPPSAHADQQPASAINKTIDPETGAIGMAVTADTHASTADVADVTGLAGAYAWERWMLKLQAEMGKDEERIVESVGAALAEGGERGAGWRCLTGWARK